MEPNFYRGDILFIYNDKEPTVPGDIVVYKIPEQEIPIVHRTIATQPLGKGKYNILTKGDNNPVNDRGLYAYKQNWLERDQVQGKILGVLPYIGILTIYLSDYPVLKWVILGIMGLMVFLSKDPQDR